jgi:hypothetical protein
LWSAGGELGQSATVSVGPHAVAVLWFRDAVPRDTLLVVAHGGLASKETLSAVCWEARRRGADCVAVDALGHGASSAQPALGTIAAMREALRVDRSVRPAYLQVAFLGHSMGAFLGRGHSFSCGQSVALGQGTDCDDDRVVWGTLHRTLGLPAGAYLLAHVLESWTPWVIRAALDHVLPIRSPPPDRLALGIALAWLSLGAALGAGLSAAAWIRQTDWLRSAAARGALASGALWLALAIGGWRTLWFLWPTQPLDLLIVALAIAPTLLITRVAQALTSAGPRTGTTVASLIVLALASVLFVTYRGRAFGGLLVLLPCMTIALWPVVALLERTSRPAREDAAESAVFVGGTLGLFLALLVPGF